MLFCCRNIHTYIFDGTIKAVLHEVKLAVYGSENSYNIIMKIWRYLKKKF